MCANRSETQIGPIPMLVVLSLAAKNLKLTRIGHPRVPFLLFSRVGVENRRLWDRSGSLPPFPVGFGREMAVSIAQVDFWGGRLLTIRGMKPLGGRFWSISTFSRPNLAQQELESARFGSQSDLHQWPAPWAIGLVTSLRLEAAARLTREDGYKRGSNAVTAVRPIATVVFFCVGLDE